MGSFGGARNVIRNARAPPHDPITGKKLKPDVVAELPYKNYSNTYSSSTEEASAVSLSSESTLSLSSMSHSPLNKLQCSTCVGCASDLLLFDFRFIFFVFLLLADVLDGDLSMQILTGDAS